MTPPPSPKARLVKCPRCRAESVYSTANSWRPFCSAHCYNLDLGAWASEGYRIASQPDEADDTDMLHTLPQEEDVYN